MTKTQTMCGVTVVLTFCAGGVPTAWTVQKGSVASDRLDARIQSARPRQYEAVRDAKYWKNPYLVIRPDGIEIIARGLPSGRTTVASTDLQRTLTRLPVAAWLYGRVVAVTEIGIREPYGRSDKAIANDLNAALALLKTLQVTVERWPS